MTLFLPAGSEGAASMAGSSSTAPAAQPFVPALGTHHVPGRPLATDGGFAAALQSGVMHSVLICLSASSHFGTANDSAVQLCSPSAAAALGTST